MAQQSRLPIRWTKGTFPPAIAVASSGPIRPATAPCRAGYRMREPGSIPDRPARRSGADGEVAPKPAVLGLL